MTGHFKDARDAIQAEASDWVLRMDEDTLDINARRELLEWLRRSPQHIEEFLFASAAWRELDDIDPGKNLDVEALIEAAQNNVFELGNLARNQRSGSARPKKSHRSWWIASVAATVLIALTIPLLSPLFDPLHHYETDVGQQTLFTLADGSIVHLNTHSKLTVHMTANARDLELTQGEAMFEVAKDPARPFRVRSGAIAVEAIGTQFNVYRNDEDVQVTVVEGTVKVESLLATNASSVQATESLMLVAGEEVRSNRAGEIARFEQADIEKRTAWREQRLVFRQDSLARVAAEFNRYNQLQIMVDVPHAATRPITATFDAHDPESFVAFLVHDPTLRVIRMNDRIEVHSTGDY